MSTTIFRRLWSCEYICCVR